MALPVYVPLNELLPTIARKFNITDDFEDFELLVESSSAGMSASDSISITTPQPSNAHTDC
jgi:hypothetical protein